MSRSVIPILTEFTYAKRIYRQININEHTSDLTLGYRFCNLLEALFVSNMKYCFRRPYYKYFDSYEEGALQGRPELITDTWDSTKKPPTAKQAIEELPVIAWGQEPLAEVIKALPKDPIAKVEKIDLKGLAF